MMPQMVHDWMINSQFVVDHGYFRVSNAVKLVINIYSLNSQAVLDGY